MSADYTKELQEMLNSVVTRGNPNVSDMKKICSVIFRINERINELEEAIVVDDKPAKKSTSTKK
jgi:hypothetical protein